MERVGVPDESTSEAWRRAKPTLINGVRVCGGGDAHQSDLSHVLIVLHNQIIFWLDEQAENRFLYNETCHHHRDWIQCVIDTSKVVEETTLMRVNMEVMRRRTRNIYSGRTS